MNENHIQPQEREKFPETEMSAWLPSFKAKMKAAKKDAFEWSKLQYNTTQGRSEVSIELSQILVWFQNEYQISIKKIKKLIEED